MAKKPGRKLIPLTKEMRRLSLMLSAEGFDDERLSKALGISRKTFHTMRKRNPTWAKQIAEAKQIADQRVERSLYERACGYDGIETKVFNHQGEIITHDIVKHYPPDVKACMHWLCNRDKARWKMVHHVAYLLKVCLQREGRPGPSGP